MKKGRARELSSYTSVHARPEPVTLVFAGQRRAGSWRRGGLRPRGCLRAQAGRQRGKRQRPAPATSPPPPRRLHEGRGWGVGGGGGAEVARGRRARCLGGTGPGGGARGRWRRRLCPHLPLAAVLTTGCRLKLPLRRRVSRLVLACRGQGAWGGVARLREAWQGHGAAAAAARRTCSVSCLILEAKLPRPAPPGAEDITGESGADPPPPAAAAAAPPVGGGEAEASAR